MIEPHDFILAHAQVVLADRIVPGWVAVSGGLIAEVGEGEAPGGIDCGGDFLIPGLIELHTDHLEPHVQPRPKVMWNLMSAVLAYDAQIAAAGITTVFDSLRVGAASDTDQMSRDVERLADTIEAARALDVLRADHLTHLRCEIATADVIAMAGRVLERCGVRLISLMDHTPGQRQFRDLEKMQIYFARHGYATQESFDALVAERLALHDEFAVENRRKLVSLAHAKGAAIASHDDDNVDHVAEAISDRVSIAEFPTTIEAARASHAAGIKVLMGAPNLVRGGSHSGNVAAQALAEAGILDILSSDYVPASLLHAAFELPQLVPAIDFPQAIRLVTRNPAEATGLADRGEIAAGRRADLVRVATACGVPVVRTVWRQGRRVV
ncbi:MAG: alpha-D-ribose 1-methylphosphonate 5-triphosphate diphosphatase [Methylobacteriaceae bacterium]|nr:alpha-D-ribose 1-methylphosphonate 5-triphosphate diphosphatase [Methylobacteriaceae bacterium]